MIGYVPQDDIVLPELTVRENILHSARIRLGCHWSDKEIQKHVDILITCLQLSHVQDSQVGDTAKPIISGGQRKRVSIGIELASSPLALFLDEPTSGLDATSAASIMALLKALSKTGITVMSIIHQPRAEIFHSLDKLLLLADGQQIYQGKTADARGYFEQLGFTFPHECNPADIMMDVITGHGQQYHYSAGSADVPTLLRQWTARQDRMQSLADYYKSRPTVTEDQALRHSIHQRGAPWIKQVYFCCRRSMLQQIRLWWSFYLEVFVAAISGTSPHLFQLSSPLESIF